MHQVMHKLKYKLAISKTYIGKVSSGFDFLGYRFNSHGLLGIAIKTVLNFIGRIVALYEQNSSLERVQLYIRRWIRWCNANAGT